MIALFQKGHVTEDELDFRIYPLKSSLEMYRLELDKLANWRAYHEQIMTLLKQFITTASNIRSEINNYTNEQKGKLMESLVDKVEIGEVVQIKLLPIRFVVNNEPSAC